MMSKEMRQTRGRYIKSLTAGNHKAIFYDALENKLITVPRFES